MSFYDGSWDSDFPAVMRFIDLENSCAKPWKLLEAHPDYYAAKNNEDRVAALRLVHDFLRTPENRKQLEHLKQKYSSAIIVPIHAIEAGGKNRIPEMLAEYISQNTDIVVNTDIIQTNRVHRTGSDEWHRFAFRPTYSGNVIPKRNYILVDDVFSLGGSFNELRRFIESNDGKVVHTIAFATGRSGPEIALNPKTLKDLLDRDGVDKLQSFLKEIDLYDGNYKALTEPEARALRRASSLDIARNRILAARCQGRPSLGAESLQKTQYQTSSLISPDNHRRNMRR
jgi:hypothetical protein